MKIIINIVLWLGGFTLACSFGWQSAFDGNTAGVIWSIFLIILALSALNEELKKWKNTPQK